MTRAPLFLLALASLLAGPPTPASAQVTDSLFHYDGIVLGQSSPAALSNWLEERLECRAVSTDGALRGCRVVDPDSPSQARALFRDDRLLSLLHLVRPRGSVDALIAEYDRRLGPLIRTTYGKDALADLRVFEFHVEPFVLLLSEARPTAGGDVLLLAAVHAPFLARARLGQGSPGTVR